MKFLKAPGDSSIQPSWRTYVSAKPIRLWSKKTKRQKKDLRPSAEAREIML